MHNFLFIQHYGEKNVNIFKYFLSIPFSRLEFIVDLHMWTSFLLISIVFVNDTVLQ